MRIRKVRLRELHMRLVTPFQISVGTTDMRRILLVEADVDGVAGWGECVAGETPMYSPETTDTAWHILARPLVAADQGQGIRFRRRGVGAAEPVRGHEMAKGALEAAVWDAEAQQKNMPLWKLLGGTRQEIARAFRLDQDTVDELVARREKGTRCRLPAHQDQGETRARISSR